MRPILMTLVVVCLTHSSFAEQKDLNRHNIGLAAGHITGSGFAYRHWFENSYGIQLTLAPYHNRSKESTSTYVNAGLTGLRILNEHERVNVVAYVGSNFRYRKSTDLYWYDMTRLPDDTYQDNRLTAGAGIGGDIEFSSISVNLKAGYRFSTDLEDEFVSSLSADVALFYSF
ncbi:hypothetical protein CHISP_1814 [Chitinispirillum alkaliphilum]|nr:hypothetical protein CHISP_1814 [Chitinispirillum alkaliphilum]